jgi:multisubunit Na+/H+ antiporter MnhB subunit
MTPLARIVSLAVLPIALMISLSHLLNAEHGPGDGFTAGIITALALTLEYLTFGFRDVRQRLARLRFERVLFGGLLLALLAAILPLFVGVPFFGEVSVGTRLPLLGDLELTTALLFDFGIYFAVVGGAMTAIDALEMAVE